jgi:hypothetical protein
MKEGVLMSGGQYWLIGIGVSLVVFIRMWWDYRTGDEVVNDMVEMGVRKFGRFWFGVVVLIGLLALAVVYPVIGLSLAFDWVRGKVFKKRSD